MRKMRNSFICIALALLFMFAIVACGNNDDAPAAGDGGGHTLVWLQAFENFLPGVVEFVEYYEAATGNEIEVQLFPAVEYDQVIRARVMSGQYFELYRTDGIRGQEYIWPPDWPYALNDRPWIDRMTATAKSMMAWSDGRITGIPITNNSAFGILYNVEIFEAAGITEVPTTWDEFLDVCQQLLDFGVTPVNIQLASGSEFGTTHMMHQLYTNIFITRGVDGANQLLSDLDHNRVQYADVPEFVTALSQMTELRDRGFINEDFIVNTFEMSVYRFASGQVAMHPCGDFILGLIADSNPDKDMDNGIGFFPLPFGDTQGTMASYAGVGVSVFSRAPQLDLALEFIDMFASKEAQDRFMVHNPGLPAFYDVVAESTPISRAIEEFGAQGLVFPGIFEAMQTWPEMENRMIIQELMLGAITPTEHLQRVQAQAEIIGRGQGIDGW